MTTSCQSRGRRRGLVAITAAAVAALASVAGLGVAQAASGGSAAKSITIAAFGGAYGEAEKEAYFDPFTKATGIKVKLVQAEASLAALKTQVSNKNALWDIVEFAGPDTYIACREGLAEKLDSRVVRLSDVVRDSLSPCGIASSVYTEGIAYDTRKIPRPPTWQDFFNVKKYPGKRAMEKYIQDGTLEHALLGAGVPKGRLYPLDVDRAIRQMKSLGDNLILVDSLAQASQLLTSGDIVMAQSAIGRILPLKAAGLSVEINLNGQRGPSFFVVPKGAKNRTEAMRFMGFIASCVECTATMQKRTAYGGPNKRGAKIAPKDIKPLLPTAPAIVKKTFPQNIAWWGEHNDEAQKAFEKFLAGQ